MVYAHRLVVEFGERSWKASCQQQSASHHNRMLQTISLVAQPAHNCPAVPYISNVQLPFMLNDHQGCCAPLCVFRAGALQNVLVALKQLNLCCLKCICLQVQYRSC